MKFCAKCGKEIMDETVICPGCGCAVATVKAPVTQQTYEQAVQSAGVFAGVGIAVLVLGIFAGLFLSVALGAVLCLVAEMLAVIPNTKVRKLFKKNNTITDKKVAKEAEKQLRKDLKKQNKAYALTEVVAIVSFIALVVFVLLW